MKNIIAFALILIASAGTSHAQGRKTSSAYWVVETNAASGNYSIVRFYDNANTLIHEVRIEGVTIDIRKARQRKKLDQLSRNYNERWVTSTKSMSVKPSIF